MAPTQRVIHCSKQPTIHKRKYRNNGKPPITGKAKRSDEVNHPQYITHLSHLQTQVKTLQQRETSISGNAKKSDLIGHLQYTSQNTVTVGNFEVQAMLRCQCSKSETIICCHN